MQGSRKVPDQGLRAEGLVLLECRVQGLGFRAWGSLPIVSIVVPFFG